MAGEPAVRLVFGKRYGEVLLVRMADQGPEADVYNTFPLNDCPLELWTQLDAATLAAEHNAVAALLNGPRYWLMSRIEKEGGTEQERKTFGGLEMLKQATVLLSSMNPAPYSVNVVDRKAVFVYDAGQPVYELSDPQGRIWVMQTYNRSVEPGILPDGWDFHTRTLDRELRIDTVDAKAQVLQDNQGNSYSLFTPAP